MEQWRTDHVPVRVSLHVVLCASYPCAVNFAFMRSYLCGAVLISDEAMIRQMINETLDNNQQAIIDFKNGKDRAVGFIVGQIRKKTQGKVNPGLTNKLVVEELKRR